MSSRSRLGAMVTGLFPYLAPNNAAALFDKTVNHASWPASTLVAPTSAGMCEDPRAPALAIDLARRGTCGVVRGVNAKRERTYIDFDVWTEMRSSARQDARHGATSARPT